MGSTLFTIAKDVKIQVEFNPAQVSQYRLLGYENRALREEDFNNDKVDAGDIGAGHQVTAIYEIVPAGARGWSDPRRYDDTSRDAEQGTRGEMAFVKLRYKLPDGTTSRLLERPVAASLMRTAARPSGDFAFATAVAPFGQRLRGDPLLSGFSPCPDRRTCRAGRTTSGGRNLSGWSVWRDRWRAVSARLNASARAANSWVGDSCRHTGKLPMIEVLEANLPAVALACGAGPCSAAAVCCAGARRQAPHPPPRARCAR